jgi:signal transduction histidine kinase
MIRVLYAEDDPQVADIVQLCFQRLGKGCSLRVVDSGGRCLEAMEAGGYDVLLLDLNMPDMDGLQVLGELTARRDPTPVVMVSGQGQHELAVRALRAGAVDCIDKNSPDFRRIAEIVKRVYERHQNRHILMRPATPPTHRVLFVESDANERETAAAFFRANAPRLELSPQDEGALARFAEGEINFDAVVLGPGLESVAMLDALRRLRARDENLPVVVAAMFDQTDITIAAFKLGAHDFLLRGQGWLTELVFSLNQALKRADVERLNAQLTAELSALNRSLAEEVAMRTRELEHEVVVRREAEGRAEEHAARLQALSFRLLRVQEDERRRIAQELHDQIGQLLTGLRFQIEAALAGAKSVDGAPAAAPSPALTEALSTTTELVRSVRELTLQLRPRVLDDLGLKPALEWQTQLFQRQTGITVELELSLPAARLPTELETTVFRVVQEALTNVARHSGAPAAIVTVTADDSALQVEISDRGRGFDAEAALKRRDSLGLAGLAERVRLAGGELELVSRAGEGTRLHANFALSPAPAFAS